MQKQKQRAFGEPAEEVTEAGSSDDLKSAAAKAKVTASAAGDLKPEPEKVWVPGRLCGICGQRGCPWGIPGHWTQ